MFWVGYGPKNESHARSVFPSFVSYVGRSVTTTDNAGDDDEHEEDSDDEDSDDGR